MWRLGRLLRGLAARYGDCLGMFVLCVVLLSMNLLVLLQVLGPFERLGTHITNMRLEGCMDC